MRQVLEHSIATDSIRAERPVRAAIYVRISSDPSGQGLGVARQEEDCRALCERSGWDVVRVYPDNDVSAYSGKPRPQWNQLLADYNLIDNSPHVDGKCDACGGELIQREDDNEEALAVRLHEYHTKTDPVLEIFRRKEYVTLIGNDTGGALVQLLMADPPARVSRVVLASCDAFDNFPPSLTGKTLFLAGRLPAPLFGLFMQQLRLRPARRLPVAFGWRTKRGDAAA